MKRADILFWAIIVICLSIMSVRQAITVGWWVLLTMPATVVIILAVVLGTLTLLRWAERADSRSPIERLPGRLDRLAAWWRSRRDR